MKIVRQTFRATVVLSMFCGVLILSMLYHLPLTIIREHIGCRDIAEYAVIVFYIL